MGIDSAQLSALAENKQKENKRFCLTVTHGDLGRLGGILGTKSQFIISDLTRFGIKCWGRLYKTLN